MKYCTNCGAKIEVGMAMCPNCGTSQVKSFGLLSRSFVGIFDIVAGGITTLAGLVYFVGGAVEFGFLASGIGLIVTGFFFLNGK